MSRLRYNATMFKRLMRFMRSKTISLIIAFALILPMVLFFHSIRSTSNVGPDGAAGLIYGKPVSWETFEQHYYWMRQRVASQTPAALLDAMRPMIQEMTWKRLLYLAEAKRQRLRVTNEELAASIRRDPAFQEHGRFSADRYIRILRALNMTPQGFEQFHRDDLLIQQLLAMAMASAAVTDAELEEAYRREREQARVSLILIDPAAFTARGAAGLTDAELEAAYQQHPESVRVPEQITFEVIRGSLAELEQALTATDEELDAYYARHADEFAGADGTPAPLASVREEVRRQTLTRKARRALAGLAADLIEAREAQRPFDEIAEEFTLTRRTVGPMALGTLPVDEGLDPDVLQQGLSLTEGELSQVLETADGVYLLRGIHRDPAHTPPFEQIRDQLRETLVMRRAREAAQAEADRLRGALQERLTTGVSFTDAAKALGVSPIDPGQITRASALGPLGAVPAVNEALFASPPDGVTPVLDASSSFVIGVLHERLPVDLSGFTDDERESLRSSLTEQARRRRLEEWTEQLEARAKLTAGELPENP